MKLNLANNPKFHSLWLNNIKNSVGASHVSYVTNSKGYFIRVIKGDKEQRFALTGEPIDVGVEEYRNFQQMVKEYYNEQI